MVAPRIDFVAAGSVGQPDFEFLHAADRADSDSARAVRAHGANRFGAVAANWETFATGSAAARWADDFAIVEPVAVDFVAAVKREHSVACLAALEAAAADQIVDTVVDGIAFCSVPDRFVAAAGSQAAGAAVGCLVEVVGTAAAVVAVGSRSAAVASSVAGSLAATVDSAAADTVVVGWLAAESAAADCFETVEPAAGRASAEIHFRYEVAAPRDSASSVGCFAHRYECSIAQAVTAVPAIDLRCSAYSSRRQMAVRNCCKP